MSKAKDALFWRSRFDYFWSSAVSGPTLDRLENFRPRRLEELRYLWRESRGRHRPSQHAVFYALEEFANEYERENRAKKGIESDLRVLASILHWAAPYFDENERYVEKEHFLSENWQNRYKDYRDESDANQARDEQLAREVESCRFLHQEINECWQQLARLDIPNEAERIWRSSAPPRRTAHEIASCASVDIPTFVKWMLVFRENLGCYESFIIFSRQPLFCRPSGSQEKLKDAVLERLKRQKQRI